MNGRLEGIAPTLMAVLRELEERTGLPLNISSGLRPGDPGEHATGKAVDLAVSNSRDRYLVVSHALQLGVNRIGVYDWHVHLGVHEDYAPNVLWIGTSR